MMRILLVCLLCLMSCSSLETNQKKDVQSGDAFRVIIPKDTWEPIFFREINERAAIAKLPNLRSALPKDDLETRIWMGFGLSALRGYDLKRSNGQWTATYLQGISPRLTPDQYQITLQPPKSGWEGFWRKLTELGLLTLPDARSVGCEAGALDGLSYVVENNIDNSYRTYMYDNPQFSKCKEAKQMIEIVNMFDDEFAEQIPRRPPGY